LYGERGAKEAVAMLSQTREQWDALKESISDSDGFIGRVAAQLEMTTKGRFQQALNTMQSNLVEAFNQSSGSVKTLADALKNLADSDEFKNTLNGLVSAVSQVSLALIEVTPLLINMGLAFAAFKGFSLLVGTVAAATSALGAFATSVGIVSSISAFAGGGLTGLKLGILATGSAAGVAAGATGLAGFSKAAALLFGPAGWVAAGIIALGSLAYAYYDAGKGASAATASADVFISGLDREIKKIREQNAELQKRNRLRAEGMDPDGIDLSAVERERAKIKSSRDALKAEMDSQPQVRTLFGLGGSTSAFKLRSQQAGLEKLDKALADADAKIGMGKLEQGVNVSAKLKTDLQGYDQQLRTLEKALDKGKNTKGAKEIAEMRKALDSYMPITGLIQDNKAASGIREYFGDKLDDTRMATLGSGDKKFVTEETPKSSSAGGAVSREVRDAQKTEAERLKDGLESGLKQKELLLRKEYLAVEVEIASQAISYSDAQIKRDQAALQAAESGLKLMEETLVKAEALTNKKDRDILILKTNNDIKEQGVKIENAQWGIVKNVTAARVAEANAIEDIGLSSSRYIKDLGFEREALNLTALEVEKLRIERERLRAIEDTRTQLNRKQISEPVAERQIQATNDTSNALIDAATEQETFVGGWSRAYKRYADEAGNAAGVATRVFNSASQSMGDALASFVQTGKLNFKDLASTIIAEATRAMVNKSVSDMLGNAGGIIKTLTGLFSPSSSVGPSAATGLGGTTWMGHSIMAPLKHSGGIVGTSEGSGSRLVSASTFYGAKRYHSGGVAGDEVPTILQKGEGVFTKGQMKAMGGGSNVQIVINNNGSKTEVQQKESIDSRGNRRVELTISDMVAGEVRRSGSSMNSALRGSFGSRQQLVGR
jgi:lambda family phage tail tape measure protein